MIYPAISVKQPWAHAIMHLGKDVENRTWKLPEKYLFRVVLIHAGQKPDNHVNTAYYNVLQGVDARLLPRGGIVGAVVFCGGHERHQSPWAESLCQNWAIAKAVELPFFACKGRLGFFEVDYPYAKWIDEAWGVMQPKLTG